MTRREGLALCLFVLAGAEASPGLVRAERPLPPVVEFNRDVRPILSENCFACHGPDARQRKAKLRLDTQRDAFADRGGYHVLVPGKPGGSELLTRLTEKDSKRHMPPAKFGKKLTARQVALIRRWVEQGAKWQDHWSLLPVQRSALPVVSSPWPRNAIDRFVLARLEIEGLRPAAEADRRTLIRRLSFDLLGLPPTPEQVDAFLADHRPDAYEKLVEGLMSSKHFGERMAIYWLDVVRYADTGGYHSDNHRDVALYRDYVIGAFNTNKRFDQFTIEQLAGDLLPGATTEQRIASGYNRLLQTTEEGGAQAREYTAKYLADRVRNTGAIWLGVTLGCAECHDHKFDPFKTREFYRFGAFFADIQERAVGRQDQVRIPTPEQAKQVAQLDRALAAVRKVLDTPTPTLQAGQVAWEKKQRAELAATSKSEVAKPTKPPVSTGSKKRVPRAKKPKQPGLPADVIAALRTDPARLSPSQKQTLARYYRSIAPELASARKELADLQGRKAAIEKSMPTTLVSTAGPPRMVRVLRRGNWLDDSGEIVQPGTPGSLPALAVIGKRANRLDLARWLVSRDNPLTARVFVNRLWKLYFGQGIVKTLDDFGSQGAWPTHPMLLDYLAAELVESGWDVKHIIRLMVESATYRQTSRASAELRQHDPYNRLLARQGRFRLDAEMVRDNALAVSGLLSRKIGGPSVKPYQPAGYWVHLNFPRRSWKADHGPDQYRRGLYTYWQRTFLHPSLLAFDAPSREECTVERPRSNTPLQALVLLNDPTFVETARALAERVLRNGGKDLERQVQFAFRLVLQRPARPEEVRLLTALHSRHLKQYQADRKAAETLLHVGDRPVTNDLDTPALAAWTSVARVLLNLHETITRN